MELLEEGFLHEAEERGQQHCDQLLLAQVYAIQGRVADLTALTAEIPRPPRNSAGWQLAILTDSARASAHGRIDAVIRTCTLAAEWVDAWGDPAVAATAMEHTARAWSTLGEYHPNSVELDQVVGAYRAAAEAWEKAGDRAAAARVWREWFHVFATAHEPEEALRALDRMRDAAAERRCRRDAALAGAEAARYAVLRWWFGGGSPSERDEAAARALALAKDASPYTRAQVTRDLWDAFRRVGLPPPVDLSPAIEIFRAENALDDLVSALAMHGNDVMVRDAAAAIPIAREAVAVARRMGHAAAEHLALQFLANAHQGMSDYGSAVAVGEQALALDVPPLSRGSMLAYLTLAARARQDIAAADRYAREAIEVLRPLGPTRQLQNALLHRAFALDAEPKAAVAHLRESVDISRAFGDAEGEAVVLAHIATILARVADRASIEEARTCLEQARGLAALPGVNASRVEPLIRQSEAALARADGELDRAAGALAEAAERYERVGQADFGALARFASWLSEFEMAQDAVSDELLARGETLLHDLDAIGMLTTRAQCAAMMARASLLSGAPLPERRARAEELLERAMLDLDLERTQAVNTTAAEAVAAQLGLHANAASIYALAVAVQLDAGNAVAAFETLERMKGRVLTEAFSFAPLRPPDGIPDVLLECEKVLLEQRALAPDIDLRRAAGRDLQHVWEEMAKHEGAREYVDVRRGATLTWPEARALLAEEEQLLGGGRRAIAVSYLVGKRFTRVFVLRSTDDVPYVAAIQLAESELRDLASLVGASCGQAALADPVASAMEMLVRVIGMTTKPGDLIVFLPASGIHGLPLHAAPVDGKPLIQRNAVIYAANLSTLRAARLQRTRTRGTSLSVVGNPTGDLPGAGREARTIAEDLHATRLLLYEKATRDAVIDALANTDILHYAGHGVFDAADPLASGLLLAGHTTLTARDVLQLPPLRARMVTLSGCETGRAQPREGDELVGLQRAFAYRGVTALGATLWKVEDDPAVFLMERFYAKLEEHCTADALREAMSAAIETFGAPEVPLWAPYILYGDWA